MHRIKLLRKLKSGEFENINFQKFINLVESFGFNLKRINGSHHIFQHPNVKELLNIQDSNGKAKAYQIKQFLSLIDRYNLDQR